MKKDNSSKKAEKQFLKTVSLLQSCFPLNESLPTNTEEANLDSCANSDSKHFILISQSNR